MSTKLNWRSIIKETVEKFKRYSIPDPISSTEFILANVLNCKRADLLLRLDEHPKEDEMERFNNLVSRRLKREPLQYILGEWEFMGLNFILDRTVAIPRPETEILVENAAKFVKNCEKPVVGLELGVGCGNIILSMLKMTNNLFMFGCDINLKPLELTRKNASLMGIEAGIELVISDLFSNFEGKFDIILSNPPYISSKYLDNEAQPEIKFEPREALDGGEDGLEIIRKIFEIAPDFLVDGGIIFMEFGSDNLDKVEKLGSTIFREYEIIYDYSGLSRVFKGVK